MNPQYQIPAAWLTLGFVATLTAAELAPGGSPADHLPPHIRQVTWFGERADWSHDGSRILFLSKTFSDSPGYKASNPVVSDDGRFIAFQMAKASEAAGVGHGLFVLDLEKMPAAQP